MSYSLTWLANVLEAAGLKVAEVPGWQERGRAEMGEVRGVICHHTAGPRQGNMPSLRTVTEGRPDLPGPLAQLGLGRDGTFYVVAAGRCNHAGPGRWRGVTTGNSSFIGIEAENTGLHDDAQWPDVQMQALRRGVAAILQHLRLTADDCAGHKEYALPPGRKTDPDFDMNAFRASVAAVMAGEVELPAMIPAQEPEARTGQEAPRPTLRRGVVNKWVEQVQRKCGVRIDGWFGGVTEAAVREVQRRARLVPDGIVGPKTWLVLDNLPS